MATKPQNTEFATVTSFAKNSALVLLWLSWIPATAGLSYLWFLLGGNPGMLETSAGMLLFWECSAVAFVTPLMIFLGILVMSKKTSPSEPQQSKKKNDTIRITLRPAEKVPPPPPPVAPGRMPQSYRSGWRFLGFR